MHFPCAARNLAPPPCSKHILLYTSGAAPPRFPSPPPLDPLHRGVAHSLKQSQASGQEKNLSSGFLFHPERLQTAGLHRHQLVAWHTANNLESLSFHGKQPSTVLGRLSPTAGALLSLHTPRYPDTEDCLNMFIVNQLKPWRVKHWCTTLEACVDGSSCHAHVMLQFHSSVDMSATAFQFAVRGQCSTNRPLRQRPLQEEAANQRGQGSGPPKSFTTRSWERGQKSFGSNASSPLKCMKRVPFPEPRWRCCSQTQSRRSQGARRKLGVRSNSVLYQTFPDLPEVTAWKLFFHCFRMLCSCVSRTSCVRLTGSSTTRRTWG